MEFVVPDEGLEPPTFGLQNRCTTAVLIRRTIDKERGALHWATRLETDNDSIH